MDDSEPLPVFVPSQIQTVSLVQQATGIQDAGFIPVVARNKRSKKNKTAESPDAAQPDDAMGVDGDKETAEGDNKPASKPAHNKPQKAPKAAPEPLVAPQIDVLGRLPTVKVARQVLEKNKDGEVMIKTVSKKERLKNKKKLLAEQVQNVIPLLEAQNNAKAAAKKASKKTQTSAFSNLTSELSLLLDRSINETAQRDLINNPLAHNADSFKNTKKDQKALHQDKEKFQAVIAHPAFQQNSIGSLQNHLQNQMALLQQVESKAQKKQHGNANKKNKK